MLSTLLLSSPWWAAVSVSMVGVAVREKKCKSFFDHLYSLIQNNSLHFMLDSQPFETILTTKFYWKLLFEMNANDDGPCWFWYWCRSFAPSLNYIRNFFRVALTHSLSLLHSLQCSLLSGNGAVHFLDAQQMGVPCIQSEREREKRTERHNV